MFKKNQDETGKSKPREPNYIFRIIAAAYILYLAYKIFSGLKAENFEDKYVVLLLIGCALFVVFGIYFIVISIKAMSAKNKKEVEEYELLKAEEARESAIQSAQYDDDDEETGVYYTIPDDVINQVSDDQGVSDMSDTVDVQPDDESIDDPDQEHIEDE